MRRCTTRKRCTALLSPKDLSSTRESDHCPYDSSLASLDSDHRDLTSTREQEISYFYYGSSKAKEVSRWKESKSKLNTESFDRHIKFGLEVFRSVKVTIVKFYRGCDFKRTIFLLSVIY